MNIEEILSNQKEILLQLRDAVLEEKKSLISDDGQSLSNIVQKKMELINALEETENNRMSNFGNVKLADMEVENKGSLQKIGLEIKEIYEEIRNHQEINLMLTQQSLDYQSMLMGVIQKAIQRAGTYGKDGKIDNSPKIKAALDRSV